MEYMVLEILPYNIIKTQKIKYGWKSIRNKYRKKSKKQGMDGVASDITLKVPLKIQK